MDKVFKLAERVKYDAIDVIKDYKNKHITQDFMDGCLASSGVFLDFITELWDVNLTDYYVEYVEE